MPANSSGPARIVVVSEIPTPYRLPLYERLAARPELDIHILFCAEEQPDRPWRLDEALARVPHSFLPGAGVKVGRRRNTFVYEINPTVVRELRRHRPDAIVVGGYAVFAEQAAIAYARARRVPYLLHSESQLLKTRSAPKRALKRAILPHIVAPASAGLAVGSAARRYLEHYGLAPERIRIVPNTIDVPRYRQLGDEARARRDELHARHRLPERYWLFAGRLVEAKGVPELVEALQLVPGAPPLLVAGEGPLASDLATAPGVRMLGFRPPETLLELMALAELTVVPSRVEPWGVVVNEALAAGCPVVVSNMVGAAEDLVVEGANGHIFPAGNATALAAALERPAPAGARERGPIDEWDYAFAVTQFLEAVDLTCGG